MPPEEILINANAHETRVGIMVQGSLQELHIERTSSRGLVGNLYLGKVSRVLPGMQSAFIDIGLERAAFLHIADLWQARTTGSAAVPIEKLLYEGQSLLVQVLKDPLGTKGARLTTQISIAGRLLVYLPQDPHIGISQKIADEAGRTALRETIQRLKPEDETGGFIVRTQAEDAAESELQADIDYLRKRWAQILENTRSNPAPLLLYQELSLAERSLRDLATSETSVILIDSGEALERLSAFAQAYTPGMLGKLQRAVGDRPLFELRGLEEEIERAMSRRVDLKSGGYLVIDQTEAMTTIDVNTGGFVSGRNFDDTVFKNNLEAAQAIARQLRLRNLGGIIIVDFIDMSSEEHRQAVLDELRRMLAKDRTRTSSGDFTSLGLIELTRKRTRESLAHILCESCPTCTGAGQIKTAQTVCYEILREIQREASQFNPREFRIIGSQDVIDLFLDEESQPLALLGEDIAKPIRLQVEPSYHQQQYDIVLG
ncbi:MAG: ribonuclease G [Burkholderiaceae bacterium]